MTAVGEIKIKEKILCSNIDSVFFSFPLPTIVLRRAVVEDAHTHTHTHVVVVVKGT